MMRQRRNVWNEQEVRLQTLSPGLMPSSISCEVARESPSVGGGAPALFPQAHPGTLHSGCLVHRD